MDNNGFLQKSLNTNKSANTQRVINRTCIVEYGIVKGIPANGVVTVELSVSLDKTPQVITCPLLTLCSDSFALNVVPKINDKVLVLFPRRYHKDMFDRDKNETIFSETARGYNLFSGVAILMNQFRPSDNKKSITVDDGVVTIAYNQNNVTLDLSENGKISIQDSNGCTYETTSESTIINGKLEIKK